MCNSVVNIINQYFWWLLHFIGLCCSCVIYRWDYFLSVPLFWLFRSLIDFDQAAIVVLWHIMVVNNWNVFLEAFGEATSPWVNLCSSSADFMSNEWAQIVESAVTCETFVFPFYKFHTVKSRHFSMDVHK